MVMDHNSPAYTAKTAGDQKLCREFAAAARDRQVLRRRRRHRARGADGGRDVRPGMLLIGTDSHSTIYGALGAAGTGVGFSEVAATWVTGYLWMRVPESIKVDGGRAARAPGVSAKDVMLKLIGDAHRGRRHLLLGGVRRQLHAAACRCRSG